MEEYRRFWNNNIIQHVHYVLILCIMYSIQNKLDIVAHRLLVQHIYIDILYQELYTRNLYTFHHIRFSLQNHQIEPFQLLLTLQLYFFLSTLSLFSFLITSILSSFLLWPLLPKKPSQLLLSLVISLPSLLNRLQASVSQ